MNDPYETEKEDAWVFRDFVNELYLLTYRINRLEGVVSADPDLETAIMQKASDRFKGNDILLRHVTKTTRLDQLAELANSTKEVSVLKQIHNEVLRLIKGRNTELNYPQPEFCPELLKL